MQISIGNMSPIELNRGNMSTVGVAFVLFIGVTVLAYALANQEVLNYLMNTSIGAKIGVFIVAIGFVIVDYASPRLKKALETGQGFVFDRGELSTLLNAIAIAVVYLIMTNPNALAPLLGDKYAPLIPFLSGIAVILFNILNPRGASQVESVGS